MNIVLTAGHGVEGNFLNLTTQAYHCIKSIKKYNDDVLITVFMPESELEMVEKDNVERVKEAADQFIVEEIEFKEFKTSAKIQALKEAQELNPEHDHLMLDSDILVLDKLDFSFAGEAAAKPESIGNQYWGEPNEVWTKHAKSEKHLKSTLTSTVDKKEIIPYFNAGVVFTRKNNFGENWLETTKKVYRDAEKDKKFCDQVSLSIELFNTDFTVLSKEYNYQILFRSYIPQKCKILHYQTAEQAMYKRYWSPNSAEILENTGLYKEKKDFKSPFRFIVENIQAFDTRLRGD